MDRLRKALKRIGKILKKLRNSKKISTEESDAIDTMQSEYGLNLGFLDSDDCSVFQLEQALASCENLHSAALKSRNLAPKRSVRKTYYSELFVEYRYLQGLIQTKLNELTKTTSNHDWILQILIGLMVALLTLIAEKIIYFTR